MTFRRLVVPLLVVAVTGVACGGDGEDSADGVAVEQPIGAPGPAGDQGSESGLAPAVAKRGALSLGVPRGELEGAAQAVVDIATAPEIGGFLVSSVLDLENGYGSGHVVVNVPAGTFEPAIAELGTVGDVRRQEMTGQDLTPDALAAVRDVARARARAAALAARLENAGDEVERAELRARLRAARSALAQASDAEAFVRAETVYSPIEVELLGERPPAPAPESPFGRAVDTSKAIALGILAAFVVAAGVVLPVGAAALLLYLAWSVVMRRLRMRWET